MRYLWIFIPLSGCAFFEGFARGAGEGAGKAAPEVTEKLLTGNWVDAGVSMAVATVAGGLAYVFGKRRQRKKMIATESVANPARAV